MQNISKNKVISAVVILAIIIVVIVTRLGNRSQNDGVIKIGGISALTGVGNAIGEEERRGMVLAVEEINAKGGVKGRNLELISEDLSIDKLKTAVSVAQKLISVDKVVAIVGAQWDEPNIPILPVIEAAKVPMVSGNASPLLEREHEYKYFFSTWYDNRVGIRELLRFAESRHITKVAIIKPLNAGFWEYTAEIFKKEALNYGVTVVDEIDLGNPLSLDFKTYILKVKEKNPEAIFAVTSDYSQCTFLKHAEQIGFTGITLGTESSGDPVTLEKCPTLMEKRFFSTPAYSEDYKAFAERFNARFGEYPRSPSAATAYDAVVVVARALEESNLRGGEDLQKALTEIKKVRGVGLSDISFDAMGFVNTPEDTYEMRTVKDGGFVKVSY